MCGDCGATHGLITSRLSKLAVWWPEDGRDLCFWCSAERDERHAILAHLDAQIARLDRHLAGVDAPLDAVAS